MKVTAILISILLGGVSAHAADAGVSETIYRVLVNSGFKQDTAFGTYYLLVQDLSCSWTQESTSMFCSGYDAISSSSLPIPDGSKLANALLQLTENGQLGPQVTPFIIKELKCWNFNQGWPEERSGYECEASRVRWSVEPRQ